MRIEVIGCTAVLATALLSSCATLEPQAPVHAYQQLPAVADMEGVVRWLELRRFVAVKVDGIDPQAEEIRRMDASIIAASELWAEEERAALRARRKKLLADGLGPQNPRLLEIEDAIEGIDARVEHLRTRYAP